jgi:hypothetical protein
MKWTAFLATLFLATWAFAGKSTPRKCTGMNGETIHYLSCQLSNGVNNDSAEASIMDNGKKIQPLLSLRVGGAAASVQFVRDNENGDYFSYVLNGGKYYLPAGVAAGCPNGNQVIYKQVNKIILSCQLRYEFFED